MRVSDKTKRSTRGLYNALIAATMILPYVMCLLACSSNPEKNLLGKWQSKPFQTKDGTKQIAFEFLADGTVVYSRKWQTKQETQGHWEPAATGTFHLINPTRLKMDWGWMSALDKGPTVYELDWRDSDHMKLQSGDGGMTEFERVK